ncbi:hypothetical protein CROQUDRAFT_91430 [Cronartium quercuum f. sp. fusiforme G11]|uniref:BZIP domain-containing protein n=1 Tax=Cronartium quercuum f. sp. fusiforme G11 TaxID=708437 RepID=A0A9P6TCM2_9BASI|nr:hypothetical protein CROQUDRAFT_91430 [Cronartium quercuum f. sp. fusiforme G11]
MGPKKSLLTSLNISTCAINEASSSRLPLEDLENIQVESNEPDSKDEEKESRSKKRKAQVRVAQRNFRERKINRQKQTASELTEANQLNQDLREKIWRLHLEREALRQNASTDVLATAAHQFSDTTGLMHSYLRGSLDYPSAVISNPAANGQSRVPLITEHQTPSATAQVEKSQPQTEPIPFEQAPAVHCPVTAPTVGTFSVSPNRAQNTSPSTSSRSHFSSLPINIVSPIQSVSHADSSAVTLASPLTNLRGWPGVHFQPYAAIPPFGPNSSLEHLPLPAAWSEFWENDFPEIEPDDLDRPSSAPVDFRADTHSLPSRLIGPSKVSEVNAGIESPMKGARGGTEGQKADTVRIAGTSENLTQPIPSHRWGRLPNERKGEDIQIMLKGTQKPAHALQKVAKCANGIPVISKDDDMTVWLLIPSLVHGKWVGFKLGEAGRGVIDLND